MLAPSLSRMLLTVCLSALAAAAGAAEALPAGAIKTTQGEVSIERDGARLTAVPGSPVLSGDRVRTARDAYVGITLRDDTVVSAGPDSVLDIAAFDYRPQAGIGSMLVGLVQGTFRVITGLIAKLSPQTVEFRTPTTTLGIRGTDFIVEVPAGAR